MSRVVLLAGVLLASVALEACTAGDRETMFSRERPPLAGRCDPQPGYPPPSERPGCEYGQGGGKGGRTR